MKLVIGNKNYSSWSLRAWLLMRATGIPFEEEKLRLDFEGDSPSRRRILAINPAVRVPVLLDDDGFAVWDTLAIAETLAERFPDKALWPEDARQRARARSLAAEMHSGFTALRTLCPMNIEADLRAVGARLAAERADLRADLARIDAAWLAELAAQGGPFLFGDRFTITDAFYAPVTWRIRGYGLPVSAAAERYIDTIHALPAMREWVEAALAEHDWVEVDEPYRQRPAG